MESSHRSPALLVALGGTGGRVLDALDSESVEDAIYVDAFDERHRAFDHEWLSLEIETSPATGASFRSTASAKSAFERLKTAFAARVNRFRTEFSDGRDVEILVVASLAGTTGGGLFLDAAAVCRETLRDRCRVHGYLCLPSLLTRVVGPEYHEVLEERTRWALAELDHARSRALRVDPFDRLHFLTDEIGSAQPHRDGNTLVADYIRRSQDAAFRPTLYESPILDEQLVSDVIIVNSRLLEHLQKTPALVHAISPRKFEEVVAALLSELGYEVSLTASSRDGGKDIYAIEHSRLGSHLYVVECKRFAPNRPVGVDVVRSLYGVTQHERATKGIVVTTSTFTKDAWEFRNADRYAISLQDYRALCDWLDEASRSTSGCS